MSDSSAPKRPRGLLAVALIVLAEAGVISFLGGLLVIDILLGHARALPTAIALALLVLAPGVALFFVARSLLNAKRWARNAAIFWQLVQLSVASASFTGRGANFAIGSALVVSSVAVIGLLFTKPVMRATLPSEED